MQSDPPQELASPAQADPHADMTGASAMQSDTESLRPPGPLKAAHHDDDQWHRLHPTSLVFGAMSRLGAFFVPLVLLLVFGAGDTWEVWAGAIILLGIFFEAWAYYTLRYRLAARELIVRRGMIFKNERHVPYARIQNIDLSQHPLHRLFRVATVRIETAGGSEPEAVLKVLSMDAIEEMRRRVFSPRGTPTIMAPTPSAATADGISGLQPAGMTPQHAAQERLLLALNTTELVRLGLTSVRGLAVVAVLMTVAWQAGVLENFQDRLKEAVEAFYAFAGASVWMYVGAVAAALTLFMVLSIAWAIWKFHGFRLVRIGDDLRLTCGLFTRLSATVPRHRVQLICIRESFVHRWMKRVSVRIETASGGSSDQGEQGRFTQKWIAPIVRREQLDGLLREINEHADVRGLDWQPLAPRARRRTISKTIKIVLFCCGLMAIALKFWALAVLAVWMPLGIWHAIASVRAAGYACTTCGMVYRSGVLIRSTSLTMFSKMQVVGATRSPFDRRWDMARLRVDTAGAGPAEHSINIAYLESDVVERMQQELTAAAQHARWQI